MFKKWKIGCSLACAALLSSTAFAEPVQSGPDSALTPAMSGQSKVVVYRGDKGYFAVLSPAYVYMNGERIVSLGHNDHTVFCVAPGKNELGTHLEDAFIYTAKNQRKQIIDLEAGKTYFYKIQDEERDYHAYQAVNTRDTFVLDTPTSKVVAPNMDNANKSRLVPCAMFEPPVAAPAKPRIITKEMTLGASALFVFDHGDQNHILPAGRAKLDKIAEDLKSYDVQHLYIVGFTDRLGDEAYNDKLSLRRAETVKAYLSSRGVAASLMTTEGRGKREQVVQCDQKNQKELVACLQPNRRVVLFLHAQVKE